VFDWFAHGTGNLVVRARAGVGKTTTALEGIEHAPDDSILLAAFNKRTAEELASRLTNPRAVAMTLHSAGFRIVKQFWEGVRIADRSERADDLARRGCAEYVYARRRAEKLEPVPYHDEGCGGAGVACRCVRPPRICDVSDSVARMVAKLTSLARECAPFAAVGDDLVDLAYAMECTPGEEWEAYGWNARAVCDTTVLAMALARERPVRTGIDFADMLYLPLANGWVRPQYGLVVIDEAQDMNASQIELARRLSSGRVCVIGDDRQSIYAFRGADSGSIDRLKRELQADELGLTTTYRCGKRIVDEARALVPDFEAGMGNPEGRVSALAGYQRLLEVVTPGDAILSRVNAPLVGLCLKLLKASVSARVEGRDVAAGLRALVRDLAKGRATGSVAELMARVPTR
jgi:hypothetical protein